MNHLHRFLAKLLLFIFSITISLCAIANEANPIVTSPTPVKLQLQWLEQAQFAGYFAAQDLGYYQAENLAVTILPGDPEISPQQILSSGEADFAIAWLPKVITFDKSKKNLVNIAQIFQRSGTVEVSWHDSGITKPADWRGKKVATWGYGNEVELYAAMRQVGIDPNNPKDVTIVKQYNQMSQLLNHQVDAAAATYNEYYQLLDNKDPKTGKNYQPQNFNIIDFNDPSINTAMLQDGIYARKDWLSDPKNQETAIKFLRASFKGWIYCRDHFDECSKIVMKYQQTSNEAAVHWQLNQINALIWPSPKGLGIMDPAAFARNIQIMQQAKIINFTPANDTYRSDLAEKAVSSLSGLDFKGMNFQPKKLNLPGS